MAWIHHEYQRHRMPLIIEITDDAEGAEESHKSLYSGRVEHISLSQFLLLFLVRLHQLTQASSDRYEVDRGHHSDRSQDEAQWDLGGTLRSTIESIIDSGVFSPHPHCKSVQQTELSRHLK